MSDLVEEDDRDDEPVVLIAHDPRWNSIYQREALSIRGALLPHGLVGIEHIGSTAIVGIAAKPIIDIVAGVYDLHALPHYDDNFWLDLGYRWRGKQRDDWLYFVKRSLDGKRLAQLHVTRHNGAFWKRILTFRDALRSSAEVAREYENLKVRLSEKYRDDRDRYRDAKSEFVDSVIKSTK